ncbi:hypothetical protein [Saprospira grandis]|uniref:Uncharacterized protein n=1 Tax=Saprospira grandis (strain Lewin) TaxID=984262 RepID=H6KZB4_SAPGL|nr:hypothetical protein [Saprospira grandis]AFC24504.1 hypothetical protein SGRA_1769 [Saprospira grandis str. Lewin]
MRALFFFFFFSSLFLIPLKALDGSNWDPSPEDSLNIDLAIRRLIFLEEIMIEPFLLNQEEQRIASYEIREVPINEDVFSADLKFFRIDVPSIYPNSREDKSSYLVYVRGGGSTHYHLIERLKGFTSNDISYFITFILEMPDYGLPKAKLKHFLKALDLGSDQDLSKELDIDCLIEAFTYYDNEKNGKSKNKGAIYFPCMTSNLKVKLNPYQFTKDPKLKEKYLKYNMSKMYIHLREKKPFKFWWNNYILRKKVYPYI